MGDGSGYRQEIGTETLKGSVYGAFRGEFPRRKYILRVPKREEKAEIPRKKPPKRNTCFGSLIEF